MRIAVLNATDSSIRASRQEVLGSLDAKRPGAWTQYGYPEEVSPELLRMAYERGGAGHGAVHRILDKCWQENPRLKASGSEDETPWESGVAALFKRLRLWAKLKDFDRRNMVGRYSALIYRVADGITDLRQPLGRGKLVDVVPLFESQIRVLEWHADPSDADNYGKPRMYQYRARDLQQRGDQQGKPDIWAEVHPSRVQILAEGSVGDMFDGVPLLRAGYNTLVDLEKITGGSAESFLKNSARTIVVQFGENATPQILTTAPDGSQTGSTVREVIEDQVKALNRNTDSSMVLQGAEVSTLQTQVANPQYAFEVAANVFAASVRLPFTILFGQQTGRLASDQDAADYNARCASRQEAELAPMVEEFVTRMQAAGAIEAGEFDVEFQPLDAPGDEEKFAIADKMSAINERAGRSGQGPVYAGSEIRRATGYEEAVPDDPLPPMPTEGDPAAMPGAQQAARPALAAVAR